MKNKIILMALFSLSVLRSYAQITGAEITIDKEVHDFGKVKVGANTVCHFKITNTGKSPLIISSAKGSCQCTVPSWPKEPIAPGASAEMTVKYNSAHAGPIAKSVTITSNAMTDPVKVIRIKGNVEPGPEQTTPVNHAGPGNH